jgi:hypothetical protein
MMMPGLLTISMIGVIMLATFGLLVKNRRVRIALWGITGIFIIGLVLFIFYALPHMLPR